MERPDFSGVWNFNPTMSSLQIPPPDSTVFVIRHQEPRFHLERTHVFGETRDIFSIDLVTDGRCVELTHGDMIIRASLYWEADALVFNSELRRGEASGTNIVRYQLTDNGRTFIALERLSFGEHSHVNTWVFERG
jgi:hypothetical protein